MNAKRKEQAARRKILIVDDHQIVREGLALLLGRERDLLVCANAAGAADMLQAIRDSQPDLVLMDVSLAGSNGIELTKSLRQQYPHLPVLILSMHDEELYAGRALKAGAKGYLMKQEPPEVLLTAIRQILGGGVFVSREVSDHILLEMSEGKTLSPEHVGIALLSDRELEVFEHIGHGVPTRTIAERLHLSPKTIEAHRARIRRKLQARTAAELSRRAVQWVDADQES